MAHIRLSKLTKRYNIGLAKLVDFLNSEGISVEMNPNASVSDECIPLIEEKFGQDATLQHDSELVRLKLKEIIEAGSKKKSQEVVEPIKETSTLTGWEAIKEAYNTDKSLQGKVIRRYMHGLIVDIDGVEAKLPQPNICDSEEELDQFIGKTIDLKVVRIFDDTKTAIVSNRPSARPRPRDNSDNIFKEPVLCKVKWFNNDENYGVVSPCEPLKSEKFGRILEIFIHHTKYDGDSSSIAKIEEDDLIHISGLHKRGEKISATKWSHLIPDQANLHIAKRYIATVDPSNVTPYNFENHPIRYILKFINAYTANTDCVFIDIFHEAFDGDDEQRKNLFNWLRNIRHPLSKDHQNQFLVGIDSYLCRPEFYTNSNGLERYSSADLASWAIDGQLPLSVVKVESIDIKYEDVKNLIYRTVEEVDKESDLFEELFIRFSKALINGMASSENNRWHKLNDKISIIENCLNLITNYNTYSTKRVLQTKDLTNTLLQYYKRWLIDADSLNEINQLHNAMSEISPEVTILAAEILEKHFIENVSTKELIKAVVSGRIQFHSWDQKKDWDEINTLIANDILRHPEIFSEEVVQATYNRVKESGSLYKAYNLLNGLDQIKKTEETHEILAKFSNNFIGKYFESFISDVDFNGVEQEILTEVHEISIKFYVPYLKSQIDSRANPNSSGWIKGAFDIVENIPVIISGSIQSTILEYIKEVIKKSASFKDQIRTYAERQIYTPWTWNEYSHIDTITCSDIDSLMGYEPGKCCQEDITFLIPIIKNERKYKEALYLADKISQSTKQSTDQDIYNSIPHKEYIELWLDGIGSKYDDSLFISGIRYYFTDSAIVPDDKYRIYTKCQNCLDEILERYGEEYRDRIIEKTLESLSPECSRSHFQTYLALINYIRCKNLNIDLGDIDSDLNLKVVLWYLDTEQKLTFTDLKKYIVLFRPCQQQRLTKKVFNLFDKKGLRPNIKNIFNLFEANEGLLSLLDKNDNEGLFDLSSRIVLYSLNKYAETGSFVFEKDMFLEILMAQLTKNAKVKYAISGFFSKCEGRTKGHYHLDNNNGVLSQVPGGYNITFDASGELLARLVAMVRRIPGRVYDSSSRAWFIPEAEANNILLLARKARIKIDFGRGNEYARNEHFITPYKSDPVEFVREFCDGVIYKEIEGRDIPIIWCGSERCFQHCRNEHDKDNWEDYTMLDFCRILDFNTDAVDMQGDTKKNGAYLMFVSWVNWFNMMLDHLYCKECGMILSPDIISRVGRYGVTQFSCRNEDCKMRGESIYLNTCLNKLCRSVIDSRDCKQCPNDWYICPTCGSCCSNDMISRRYMALVNHDQYINETLRIAYEQHLGHEDSNTVFCYYCGSETRYSDQGYTCQNCGRTLNYRNRKNNNR